LENTEVNPDVLYKFRDWSNPHHKRIITNDEIYFASPNELNDPFDCSIPIRYDKASPETIRELVKGFVASNFPDQNHQWRREKEKEILKKYPLTDSEFWKRNDPIWLNQKNINFGIFSLSGTNTDILLWSHYSKNHQGFCLGYSFDSLSDFSLNQSYLDIHIDFVKVKYSVKYPLLIPKGRDDIKPTRKSFMTKAINWSYEKEWRLIMVGRANKNRVISMRKYSFNTIYLGCKIPDEHKDEILEEIKKKEREIKVYQAKMRKDKFALDFDLV